MNKILIIASLIFMVSCSPKSTFMYVAPSDNRITPNVFENDTIKLTYYFGNGRIEFSAYNKLNIPLYIDWKNSAFIENDKKIAYWRDEESVETISKSSGYYAYGVGGGKAKSMSNVSRPERITSIPPHSKIFKSAYILPGFIIKTTPLSEVPAPTNKSKIVKARVKDYTRELSPYNFRNFIAISTTDSGPQFFVDNAFYLHRIMMIKWESAIDATDPMQYHLNSTRDPIIRLRKVGE